MNDPNLLRSKRLSGIYDVLHVVQLTLFLHVINLVQHRRTLSQVDSTLMVNHLGKQSR